MMHDLEHDIIIYFYFRVMKEEYQKLEMEKRKLEKK